MHINSARLVLSILASLPALSANHVVVAQNLIANPGFEVAESTGDDLPNAFGDWSGNYSAIVGSENGVNAHSGQKMLRFNGTQSVGDGAGASIGGNVFQLIDVSQWASEIASGQVSVSASAFFNRVVGDAQTDFQFSIEIFAYSGSPADFPNQALSAFLLRQSNCLLADANVGTWQPLSTQALLPPETTYIAVNVSAIENVYNDLGPTEFDGHYADDVVVEINAPCLGDLNGSETVDVSDLLMVINAWGSCAVQ